METKDVTISVVIKDNNYMCNSDIDLEKLPETTIIPFKDIIVEEVSK